MPAIMPMHPTLIREPFHRRGWVYEEKVDGDLDGEVAIFDQQLRSRFDWLREPDQDAVATPPLLMVFDLLWPASSPRHAATPRKTGVVSEVVEVVGAPGVTRTPGTQFRKLLLYPPELRGRLSAVHSLPDGTTAPPPAGTFTATAPRSSGSCSRAAPPCMHATRRSASG